MMMDRKSSPIHQACQYINSLQQILKKADRWGRGPINIPNYIFREETCEHLPSYPTKPNSSLPDSTKCKDVMSRRGDAGRDGEPIRGPSQSSCGVEKEGDRRDDDKILGNCERKQELVEPGCKRISIARQCEIVGIPRASNYYQAVELSQQDRRQLRTIDEECTRHPFRGSRRMRDYLHDQDEVIYRDRLGD